MSKLDDPRLEELGRKWEWARQDANTTAFIVGRRNTAYQRLAKEADAALEAYKQRLAELGLY